MPPREPRIYTAEEARALREAATPGPWVTSGGAVVLDVCAETGGVCEVYGPPVHPECRANAALLAAAPDLAATVEHLNALLTTQTARADGAEAEAVRLTRERDHAIECAANARADLDALRAIIEGRTTPPTPREIEVHAAADGWWLWECDTVAGEDVDPEMVQRVVDVHRQKQRATRWWAMGANRLPCAWPVATEAPDAPR